LEKSSVSKRIDEVVGRAKSVPPKKSVDMVLFVCEDILCQPIDGLPTADRDILPGALAQYNVVKRQIAERERAVSRRKRMREKGKMPAHSKVTI
jgi:hypothetical protein